jgi:hypothetical protein
MSRENARRQLLAVGAGLLTSWLGSLVTVALAIAWGRGLPNVVYALPLPHQWWGEYIGTGILFTPAVLLGLISAIHVARRLELLAGKYPRCGNCGYILRGLPEPRCPECGTPI